MTLPESLLHNSHFMRYYRMWQKDDRSLVFVPLAQIFREHGFLEEALEMCRSGLERHPDSVSGKVLLAQIYLEQKKTDEAATLLKKVLAQWPHQKEALALLRKMQGTESHATSIENSLPLTDSLWDTVSMARIYADQGDLQKSRSILEKILARRPSDARALKLKEELRQ